MKQRADTRIQLGNNVRYFPSTLPHLRADNLHLFDFGLYKNFQLPRKMRLQVRIEVHQRAQLHRPLESGR